MLFLPLQIPLFTNICDVASKPVCVCPAAGSMIFGFLGLDDTLKHRRVIWWQGNLCVEAHTNTQQELLVLETQQWWLNYCPCAIFTVILLCRSPLQCQIRNHSARTIAVVPREVCRCAHSKYIGYLYRYSILDIFLSSCAFTGSVLEQQEICCCLHGFHLSLAGAFAFCSVSSAESQTRLQTKLKLKKKTWAQLLESLPVSFSFPFLSSRANLLLAFWSFVNTKQLLFLLFKSHFILQFCLHTLIHLLGCTESRMGGKYRFNSPFFFLHISGHGGWIFSVQVFLKMLAVETIKKKGKNIKVDGNIQGTSFTLFRWRRISGKKCLHIMLGIKLESLFLSLSN